MASQNSPVFVSEYFEGTYDPTQGTVYRNGDVLSNLLDDHTGEYVTFRKVINDEDGTPMDDSKVDGVIYQKLLDEYFERVFYGSVHVAWWGILPNSEADYTNILIEIIARYDTVYIPKGLYHVGEIGNVSKRLRLLMDKGTIIRGITGMENFITLQDGASLYVENGRFENYLRFTQTNTPDPIIIDNYNIQQTEFFNVKVGISTSLANRFNNIYINRIKFENGWMGFAFDALVGISVFTDNVYSDCIIPVDAPSLARLNGFFIRVGNYSDLSGSGSCVFSNNTCENFGDLREERESGAVRVIVSRSTIIGNSIANIVGKKAGSGSHEGIYAYSSCTNIVGNTLNNAGGNQGAIVVKGGTIDTVSLISSNIISYTEDQLDINVGIFCSANNLLVTNNLLFNVGTVSRLREQGGAIGNTQNGVQHDLTIKGNKIYCNGPIGLELMSTGGVFNIEDNEIYVTADMVDQDTTTELHGIRFLYSVKPEEPAALNTSQINIKRNNIVVRPSKSIAGRKTAIAMSTLYGVFTHDIDQINIEDNKFDASVPYYVQSNAFSSVNRLALTNNDYSKTDISNPFSQIYGANKIIAYIRDWDIVHTNENRYFAILDNYNARIFDVYPNNGLNEGLRLAIHWSGDGTNRPTSFTEGRVAGSTYWNSVKEKQEWHTENGRWTEDLGYKTNYGGDLNVLTGNNVYTCNTNITNGPSFPVTYVINVMGVGNIRHQVAFGRLSNQLAARYFNGNSWDEWNILLPDAPSDGNIYARQNGQWVAL